MAALARLLGLLIAAFGIAILSSPQFVHKVFDFMSQGKRIYYAGIFRVAAGLVLLIASPGSAVPLAAIALGVVFLVSGIVIFAADVEKVKSFIKQYQEMPALVIRLLGIIAASFGILIVSVF